MKNKKGQLHKNWNFLSWEPELFISVGLIVFLFKSEPLFNQLFLRLLPYDIRGLGFILLLLVSLSGGLMAGFVLHLILRTYWLMLAGFSHIQRSEHSEKELHFKTVFGSGYQGYDVEKASDRMATLSSLTFSITLFLFISSIGASFLLICLQLAAFYFQFPAVINGILIIILFFDFISFGYLKKRRIGTFLYPLLQPLYYLSLSFLYKPVYYFLLRHIKKQHLAFIMSGFLVFSVAYGVLLGTPIIFKSLAVSSSIHQRNLYEDEADQYEGDLAQIESYYQNKDVLRLFIAARGKLSDNLDAVEKLSFQLDSIPLEPYAIRQFEGDQDQYGMLCFFNISPFENGKEYEIKAFVDNEDYVIIPFFKGR